MRTVSFVERVEFEYNGNLFSKAIAVGDVDNDKAYKFYYPSIIAHNVTFHNYSGIHTPCPGLFLA